MKDRMNKAKNLLLVIAIVLGIQTADLQAGEPVTDLLICCRGSAMGPFLINGKWENKHDYSDVEQVRGILTNIQNAVN